MLFRITWAILVILMTASLAGCSGGDTPVTGVSTVTPHNTSVPPATPTRSPDPTSTVALTSTPPRAVEQIAYVGQDGNLWLVNLDGNHRTQLTSVSDGVVIGYTWSPDGGQIMFVQTRGDDKQPTDMYLLDLNAGQATMLLSDVEYYEFGGIAWSPTGNRVAFTTDFALVQLLDVADREAAEIFIATVYGVGAGSPPRANALNWSPDGSLLAVDLYGTESTLLGVAASDPFAVVAQQYSVMGGDRSRSGPVCALDGTERVAWIDWEDAGSESIVVTDDAGATLVQIPESDCIGLGPNTVLYWNPNGREIAVSGNDGLCLVDVETGAWQSLVSDRGTWNPSWPAAGDFIVFSYVEALDWSFGERGIGAMNVGERKFINLDAYGAKPSFRPATN